MTPEEARDKVRAVLEDVFKDDAFVIDFSTPNGVLAWARSLFPEEDRERIIAAEIIDGVLNLRLATELEYIVVNFTTVAD